MKNLLLLALATWRLTNLLTDEQGPFDMFVHMRHKLGVRKNAQNENYGITELGKLFSCIWCLSPWIGLLFSVVYYLRRGVAIAITLPLSLSALALLYQKILRGKV